MRDSPGMTNSRGLLAMVGVCTVILVAAALYLARSVFAPMTFALFVIAMVWPLQKAMQARLPKLVALAITIVATIVIITAVASMIVWGFGRVGRYMASDAARFQLLFNQYASWLEERGIAVAGLWAEHFNMTWLLRLAQQITARVNNTLSFSIVVLIYVLLGLLEVDTAASKLREMRNAAVGKSLLAGSAETAAKLRRYMLVRSLMSIMTGILVWAFAYLTGLPLAAEWGVIAFVLNYIPFLGPFVATLFPTLFAIAQFQSWQMTLMVFAGLNLIQFVVGSYLEPRIAGRVLSISPFIVLLAVLFWTFLWGIAGAFIGVPIVIAVLTICRQYPSSQWLAELLGGERRNAPAAS